MLSIPQPSSLQSQEESSLKRPRSFNRPLIERENRPILRELEYRVLYGNPEEDRGVRWTPGWGRVRVNAFYVPLVPKPKGEESATPISIS